MNQRRLGKYELQERLGWDTISNTWKAFDTELRRYVTVKIITINLETSGEFLPRFNQEGQAVAALNHPNIVHLQEFTVAPDGGEVYIVTDYVEGQSLTDYLNATTRMGQIPSSAEIVQLLTPIAAALDYAHQQRVVHGALNPTVILLDKTRAIPPLPGVPMITDFGMRPRQDPRLQSLEEVSYIAPEVAQGNPATNRSDLYSLGVILYELCTGTLPFQGDTSSDVLMQHIHSAPISPVLINPYITPALTGVIMRSLARNPASRFSTATALVAAISKATSMSGSTGLSNPGLSGANFPSFSGISDPNSPTYITPSSPSLPSSQSGSIPRVGASGSMPALPQPPVAPAITPVLPVTPSGSISGIQPPVNVSSSPPQASGPHPVLEPRGSMPMTAPVSSQASGAYPVLGSQEPTFVTPSALPLSEPVGPPRRPFSAFITSGGKRRVVGFALLAVVLIAALIGSGVLLYPTIIHSSAASSATIVGHAYFTSSGLISTGSNQGITDGFQISLENVSAPQAGKQYYGWLKSSSNIDVPALPLGALSVDGGKITKTYTGEQRNNLLANYDSFLITEEDANQQPANPSLDVNTWRYSAVFSTVASTTDPKHYSLYDHLKHLLSQDPKLQKAGLVGGLDVWLFRNTSKILEAAGSIRDTGIAGCNDQACADLISRQVIRILDYLDGADYIQTENIPSNMQQVLIDPTIAKVALLEFDQLHQEPPGYLQHIGTHLQSIEEVPNATAAQRALATHINQDINNVQGWLDALHKDASQLVHMSPADLSQPGTLALFNDLFNQANAALVGQVDPNTDNVKEGVVQIHYAIQALATFDVTLCTMNNGKSSCA